MADVKKYSETTELPGGALRAEGPDTMPQGQRSADVTKFAETREDEHGNLIATGRDPGLDDGRHAGATVLKRYDKTEEGPDGHLHVTGPAPDFAE